MTEARVALGTVRSVNAKRRELRIVPERTHRHEFESLQWLWLAGPGLPAMRCPVTGVRDTGTDLLVTLGAGVPRERVGLMRGARAELPEGETTPRPQDDWEMQDLLGLRAVAEDGTEIGTIAEVFETPANAAMAIARPDGSRLMLPVIPEVVTAIDFESQSLQLGDTAPYAVED